MRHSALFDSFDTVRGACFSVRAGVAQVQPDGGLEDLIAAAEKEQAIFYECRK
jgi:hypothetical protein